MKRRKFDAVLKSVAELFRVMAHPDRIRLLGLLHQHHELDVSQLHEALEISQSAASQHLKLLKLQGLVIERREGHHVYYRLKNEQIKELVTNAIEYQAQHDQTNRESRALLKEMNALLQ